MRLAALSTALTLTVAMPGWAAPVLTYFEGAGATPASITSTRDVFRAAIGGGSVAGSNGSFGGLLREINWDGVPTALSDPNLLPGDFFNTTSPRGAVLSTPGTGFLVSASSGGATAALFGFASDFQVFSPQKLFTAVNSTVTDVRFFVPGTTTVATVSAFGVMFVDVELEGSARLDFYDETGTLAGSRTVLAAGNQGLSFTGATVTGGAFSKVRITSGANTITANGQLGNPNDDVVVMDDFLYAEPQALTAVPEPSSLALAGFGLLASAAWRIRRR